MMKMAAVLMGSDPRVATCRGRLQTRRCQLNQEINKELRLRAGAENLFKATTNRKLRETVALELSFVNSNLQLLKEQLAELNSSVELYQNDSQQCVMPMIPLGLKETKEVDFREPFKDFILEHYSEDAATYEDAISDFMDMRQAMRTPVRSTAGVALLFKYYNQLYFIERRFFPPDRSLGVYFEWFDSLTGVPSCQRTVAFEKACVLFNMAGIYTQIGAKQERSTCAGLDGAVDALLRAAGTLRYIHENFTNAPSVDLAADTLLVLGALMTAQARECLFEKLQLQAREASPAELRRDLDMCLDLAQESAQLAHTYRQLYDKMQSEGVFNYVPYSWVSLVHVKTEFYKALAHQYCASGLLHAPSGGSRERLLALYAPSGDRTPENGSSVTPLLKDQELDYMALGRAHLAEALTLYEEALRLQRMCRELRSKQALSLAVRAQLERAARERPSGRPLDPRGPHDPDDFADLLDAPHIHPSSKFQLSLTPPDFAQHRVEDLFKSLGPIAIFSAKRHWSAPRLVQLQKNGDKRLNGRPEKRNGRLDEQEHRNGKRTEKRDRSEDNSTYYNQVIRSDEKYTEEYEKKKLHRVTKQNGVYINSYNNNNNYDYHPKVLDYDKDYNCRNKPGVENGVCKHEVNGKVNGRERKKGELRRVASEYNVSNGKSDGDGFGFSVRGDAPVIIAAVEPNSLADIGGMREGDFIISIGDKDVKWSSHDEVVRLIQQTGDTLTMRLASPMDKSCLKASPETTRQSNSNQGSVSAASTASSGSTAVTARSSARRAPSWNPFRRHTTRDTSSHRGSHTNVIFR
ncbi:rhophilin-2-B isoform X2 [Achroia grisella]|uniref:rhophilin-2-B isoform X2 n=1 Tax=Achroia grisella TaxID=688607 RepID=UPI0027D296A3|nr:rhophilin-2-B isoform X2 [Achroia grisella]XP_059055991.1 rhophilin-2-B isoform X2 [Achroia grisella]XP_059055992.1 rhophilin-2-B isoform X2 [Achroia grisella]XP_059055993.1 rhophilin-2-B isoform X2 [Achroia grisella]XP_059055994.1 rhophilin-2-B isoform X2 [Achroia grisella]